MTMRERLLHRIRAVPRAFVRRVAGIVRENPSAGQVGSVNWGLAFKLVMQRLRKEVISGDGTPAADRAQWRRWYQANTKRQRQMRALHGVKIPTTESLRREMVR